MIFIDQASLGATGLASLHRYIHSPPILALTICSAALMALTSLFFRAPLLVILLIPQQVLLMMSAAGVSEAIWLAQYADGVIRSRSFIAADQMYSILAAIGHTAAIIGHAMRTIR